MTSKRMLARGTRGLADARTHPVGSLLRVRPEYVSIGVLYVFTDLGDSNGRTSAKNCVLVIGHKNVSSNAHNDESMMVMVMTPEGQVGACRCSLLEEL